MGRGYRPGSGLTGRVNGPRVLKDGVCQIHGTEFIIVKFYGPTRRKIVKCTVCIAKRHHDRHYTQKAEYREGLDMIPDDGASSTTLVKIPLVCGHDTLFQMRHLPKWNEVLYCERCEDYHGQERARARVPSL